MSKDNNYEAATPGVDKNGENIPGYWDNKGKKEE